MMQIRYNPSQADITREWTGRPHYDVRQHVVDPVIVERSTSWLGFALVALATAAVGASIVFFVYIL